MALLLAIDPSLTCSGWALFNAESLSLEAVGKVKSLAPAIPLQQRYADLQVKVNKLLVSLGVSKGDILVCEAETTMRDPKAAFKVEHVRGLFEMLARSLGLEVPGRLNPRTVHNEVMGLKGRQLKREIVKTTAVSIVQTLYGRNLQELGLDPDTKLLNKNQDIVDAILVGHLAVHRVKSAKTMGIPCIEMFQAKMRRASRGAYR